MTDPELVAFLQDALPRLGLRWPGYRKVRRTVGKRLARRLRHLGLADLAAYRAFLAAQAEEWNELAALCRIPISRFYRDRGVFDALRATVFPALAQAATKHGDRTAHAWSAGCAAGEEPYTLTIAWHMDAGHWPAAQLQVVATDAELLMLERARLACYGAGSLKDLPAGWRDAAFAPEGARWCLKPEFRAAIAFRCEDLRAVMPDGPFDLILCRNLAFTYFDEAGQARVLAAFDRRLGPGGFLVIGRHEKLPGDGPGFVAVDAANCIFRRQQ